MTAARSADGRFVRLQDRDHGYAARIKAIEHLAEGDLEVVAGILAKTAAQAHAGGATTVLDVALWAEFGTPTAPARSFIRVWFDQNKAEGHKKLTDLLRRVVAGKLTEPQALEQFGLWMQGSIQARMAAGIPPPNAPSTVRQKGSSTPLIDSGQLRSSVASEVRRR